MPHPARLIPILAALSPVTLLPSWATPPARPAVAVPAEARPDPGAPGPTPSRTAADDPAASTLGAPAPAAPTSAAPAASLAGDPDLRPSGPQPSGALPRVTPSNGQRPSDALPPVTVSNGLLRSAPLPEGSSPTASLPTVSLPLESPPTGPLPTGLARAGLRAGWTEASGARILALELQLEPGWKTYWRSPGDSGLPPQLDWSGSENLSHVALHWPAPEPIRSGAALELGYHDRLVLPLTAWPLDPARPVEIRLEADLGLCRDICVPAALSLAAAPPGPEPDPAILHALARVPRPLPDRPVCEITPIADGLRVAMTLPGPAPDPDPAATSTPTLAAIEIEPGDGIWVSGAEIQAGPQGPRAVVEMVGPSNAPFPLDRDALRLTVLPADGGRATETRGCAPG